ncbi:hypothetical protein Hypma_003381 [Hypsizygus marmoreus]|uniref:Uncharacterized protein n=1 Tax=Hypsizygus marmoreus TaxID=39966 RepID=A0A369J281_HYPMA|nr:hypothetical protein Hypma_003381 [Hypsizygus marmoreus]
MVNEIQEGLDQVTALPDESPEERRNQEGRDATPHRSCHVPPNSADCEHLNLGSTATFSLIFLPPQIIRSAASDPAARDLLVKSAIPRHRSAFTEKLVSFEPSLNDNFREPERDNKLIDAFLDWCAKAKQIPEALKTAINERKSLKGRFRKLKRRFIRDAGLAPNEARQASSSPKFLPPPSLLCPPRIHPLAIGFTNKRKKKLSMHALIPENLQHDILEDQSRIFRDSEGNFIGMVKREFLPLQAGVEFVDDAIKEATTYRKSIHLEDPVYLHKRDIQPGRAQPLLLRLTGPGEVLDDFSDFLAEMGSLRMDGNGQLDGPDDDGLGKYTVKIGDDEFQFHGAELAPPAGVCAENYSRANHYEFQPHMFGAAWTTSRSRGFDAGGTSLCASMEFEFERHPTHS